MFEVQFHTGDDGSSIINIYTHPTSGYGGWYVAKPIELVFEKIEEGKSHEPTLKLNHFDGKLLMEAFAKVVSKDEEDSIGRLKGEIKAMKAHINDLKTLLQIREETKLGRMLRPKE